MRLLALILTGVGMLSAPPVSAEPPASARELDARFPQRHLFGMNLSSTVDWSPELPLVDVFKTSRPWIKRFEGDLSLDDRGYPKLRPGQAVETVMLWDIDDYPAGVYVVTYRGTGDIRIKPEAGFREVIAEGPGRIEVVADPKRGGLRLALNASDPADPVRDIHVWMPGTEGSEVAFNPVHEERLRPFGTVRFMDWMATNNSPIERWVDRTEPDDARYCPPGGMPAELLIAFANRNRMHPWFCMPHRADDGYVREFARLVRDRLDPGLKAHVEYSNEVWNFGFDQARYALGRGRELKLGDRDGAEDFRLTLRFYSQRSVEVFKIWEGVFGGTDRLVRVLGSQAVNSWVSEQVMDWNGAHESVDALAIAPYFGNDFGAPERQAEVARLSVDALLDRLATEIDDRADEIKAQAAVAKRYNVPLLAYEGGQHLVGVGEAANNQALTDLFIAANRNPRMYDLYRRHYRTWIDAGGGLYVAFSNVSKPVKWGSWGLLEYQSQPIESAHKYRATVDFIGQPRATSRSD